LYLRQFAASYDAVVFVGGQASSNARVLFEECKAQNPNSYFVTSVYDVDSTWFSEIKTVGICGATSTPEWLMEQVAKHIRQF
jgi:4-hydroxy-3-methylbut-2-enyl diphosphate reductase